MVYEMYISPLDRAAMIQFIRGKWAVGGDVTFTQCVGSRTAGIYIIVVGGQWLALQPRLGVAHHGEALHYIPVLALPHSHCGEGQGQWPQADSCDMGCYGKGLLRHCPSWYVHSSAALYPAYKGNINRQLLYAGPGHFLSCSNKELTGWLNSMTIHKLHHQDIGNEICICATLVMMNLRPYKLILLSNILNLQGNPQGTSIWQYYGQFDGD